MKTLSQKTLDAPQEVPKTSRWSGGPAHRHSLRSKLVLALLVIFLLFLLIDEVVRQQVIEPGFAALERAGAVRDAKRVIAALNAEVDHLGEVVSDQWFSRKDVDDFADAVNLRFAGSEWIAHFSADGSWRWLRCDPNASQSQQDATKDRLQGLLENCLRTNQNQTSGLTKIPDQTLAIFCAMRANPVQSPQETPRDRDDYLVIARGLSQERLDTIREQTLVDFSLAPSQEQGRQANAIIRPIDHAILMAEVPLLDIQEQHLANICIRVPREITARVSQTTRLARNAFIFGSVTALLVLLVLLQKIIIGPLVAIREHSYRVAEQGFATKPLLLQRNDEIGQLANAFDKVVRNLSDAQNQLAQASQAAGRSEVASTVIHNVGNVLTNVNSLLDAARAGVEGLRIGPLEKLAKRLRTDSRNESMLAATPDYLTGLAGSLKCDQASIQQLLSTLHDNVCHIHDVIRDQQQYTGTDTRPNWFCVQEIVEEAIACCRARLDEDHVEVEIGGCLSVDIRSDRSLLLQTMINIIGNARHALRVNADRPRRLTILVEESETSVRILFRDNGCGMTSETLRRVFDAHFTTREGGTGLGLHFCSLTLKRLQGSIRASSEGPGEGSLFVVELPRDALANSSLLGALYRSAPAASMTSCTTTS